MKRALIVIGAAFVLMVGGAVAYAAIPSADGTISACYTKPAGALRVIDSGGTCKKGEAPLTWDQGGGISGYERVVTEETVPTSVLVYHGRKTASCSAGKVLTGGGATMLTPTGGGSTSWDVFHNGPIDEDTWEAAFFIPDDGREDPVVVQVVAFCVNAN